MCPSTAFSDDGADCDVTAFNLINSVDVATTEARILAYQAENRELIATNLTRQERENEAAKWKEEEEIREKEEAKLAYTALYEDERREAESIKAGVLSDLVRAFSSCVLQDSHLIRYDTGIIERVNEVGAVGCEIVCAAPVDSEIASTCSSTLVPPIPGRSRGSSSCGRAGRHSRGSQEMGFVRRTVRLAHRRRVSRRSAGEDGRRWDSQRGVGKGDSGRSCGIIRETARGVKCMTNVTGSRCRRGNSPIVEWGDFALFAVKFESLCVSCSSTSFRGRGERQQRTARGRTRAAKDRHSRSEFIAERTPGRRDWERESDRASWRSRRGPRAQDGPGLDRFE